MSDHAGRRKAAIVLYSGNVGAEALSGVCAEVPPELGDLYVLHTGLDPHAVATATRDRPDIRFLRASVEHYRQFKVGRSHHLRLLALDALRLEGYERLLVAPVSIAVIRLGTAALAWRPGSPPPGPAWTTDVGAGRNRVLLLGGGLAREETIRRLDQAMADGPAPGRTPWRALSRVREELVASGTVPRDGAFLLAAPGPERGAAHAPPPAGTERTPSELLEDARARIADGDFPAAREILLTAVHRPGGLAEPKVLTLARVLRARSEYDAARNVLHLLYGHPSVATRAAAEAAEIAWVQHDYARGEELALYALRANPVNRRAQIIRDRCRQPLTTRETMPERESTGPLLSHVAFYVSAGGNFGDIVLPETVRESVASVVRPAGWLPVHAHQVFDRERLELVNETDGVIVGGGGLFLPDTAPNGNSGWQWNIPRDHLDKLSVPLAVVAVGFNLFQGQSFHGTLFRDNLTALVERADVVGLRNYGSVRHVQAMLPDRLAEKVSYLPCPTTVLSHVHARPSEVAARGAAGAVLVNAAFDRSARRFGDRYEDFLARMAAYVRRLKATGAEVRCLAHLPADEKIADDLAAGHGIRLPIDALYDLPVEEGYELYRRAGVVVGMRGHATMIPFGLGTPVLSLISHPKLRYFLEDIDRPEWGFDVHDPALADAMAERTLEILAHQERSRADVAALQPRLLEAVQRPLTAFINGITTQSALTS